MGVEFIRPHAADGETGLLDFVERSGVFLETPLEYGVVGTETPDPLEFVF